MLEQQLWILQNVNFNTLLTATLGRKHPKNTLKLSNLHALKRTQLLLDDIQADISAILSLKKPRCHKWLTNELFFPVFVFLVRKFVINKSLKYSQNLGIMCFSHSSTKCIANVQYLLWQYAKIILYVYICVNLSTNTVYRY